MLKEDFGYSHIWKIIWVFKLIKFAKIIKNCKKYFHEFKKI